MSCEGIPWAPVEWVEDIYIQRFNAGYSYIIIIIMFINIMYYVCI